MAELEKYGLDLRCTMILEDFIESIPALEKMREIATDAVRDALKSNSIEVISVESRVKSEESLAGKLALKGGKYSSVSDITDLLGIRVITFYSGDVDKIAAIIEKLFSVDWQESVDKRKMHELNSFGYMSLHYICRIPTSLYSDPTMPQINGIRFEVQMRTALQHVWANMYHDTGYKSGIEIPREHLRNLNRLAGMLELADEEFNRTRNHIAEYRRIVENLVKSGRFEEVFLDGDTFKSYLELEPFSDLTKKVAEINQAEIHESSQLPYLKVFKDLGFKTLGDIDNLIKKYSEDAYQLAISEIGGTDIDIISSTIGVQNLCIVYTLENGGGKQGLKNLFDNVYGESKYNIERAERLMEKIKILPFYTKTL